MTAVMQPSNEQCLETGHKVVTCLKAAGLSVSWAETIKDTILVKVQQDFDAMQHRRFSASAHTQPMS